MIKPIKEDKEFTVGELCSLLVSIVKVPSLEQSEQDKVVRVLIDRWSYQ